MKLLLTSAGVTNKSIAASLGKLVRRPKSKIAFVPTAANVEPGDKGWLIDDLSRLKELGYSVDIVDISAIGPEHWLPRLEAADVLFFGGGDPFHLLRWVRKSGLANQLPALLRTRIYAGISAGSIVAAPNLRASSLRPLYPDDVGPDSPGLNLVDFHVRPHLNSPYFPQVRKGKVESRFQGFTEPVYVIDDQTTIVVDGDHLEVISEGEYLKL